MSAGLRGDLGKLRRIEQSIRHLPRVIGAKVATACAGKLTTLVRATFNAGQNAYGDPWSPSASGERLTLKQSGALAASLGFSAAGTRLWARLGPKYSKYVVGPRPVLPTGKLPRSWAETLRVATDAVISAELKGA